MVQVLGMYEDMNTLSTTTAVLCIPFAIASYSMAEDLTIEYLGTRGVNVVNNIDVDASWDAATRLEGGEFNPSGLMTLNVVGGGEIKVFCSQVDQLINRDEPVLYNQVGLNQLRSTLPIGLLKAQSVTNHYYHNYSMVTEGNSGIINSAFQLVIWEITGENWDGETLSQLDLSLGAVQFELEDAPLILNQAQAMINNLTNNPNQRMKLSGWANENSSDFIVVVPGPTAIIAGAIGIAGLRRRRRN